MYDAAVEDKKKEAWGMSAERRAQAQAHREELLAKHEHHKERLAHLKFLEKAENTLGEFGMLLRPQSVPSAIL